MRPLKFRAWDKSKNCWEHRFRIDSDGGVIVHRPSDKEPWVLEWREFSDYELMQYTGLKDKNGTEVYEEDLLRVDSQIYEVIFNPKSAAFVYGGNVSIFGLNFSFGNGQEIEVIGNIYENPELVAQPVEPQKDDYGK